MSNPHPLRNSKHKNNNRNTFCCMSPFIFLSHMIYAHSHMTDAGTQLKDTTSDSPLTGMHYQENSHSPSQQDTTLTSDPLPSASLSSIISANRPISSPALLPLTQGRGEARPWQVLFQSSTTQGSLKGITRLVWIVLCIVYYNLSSDNLFLHS